MAGELVAAVTDQVRTADVDAVIVPSASHLDPLTLNSLMGLADVEAVLPRLSFARWPMQQSGGGVSTWGTLGLLLVVLPLSVGVYCVVVYWPERRLSDHRTNRAEPKAVDSDTDSNT